MSRPTLYVRKPTDKLKKRIEKSKNLKYFVLQETGPTAFVISDEESNGSIFKVALGNIHRCSCGKYALQGNLCHHVLWVMQKIFQIPGTSELLYQTSLVPREIDELISSREENKKKLISSVGLKTEREVNTNETYMDFVPAREIHEDDVCPICQEHFDNEPVMHCKLSCGNNVHQKCLRVLIKHQKALDVQDLKCPLCRNTFGNIKEIEIQIQGSKEHYQPPNHFAHNGYSCSNCNQLPIIGNLYRCTVCKDNYLCSNCFLNGAHHEHVFEFKERQYKKWQVGKRAVQAAIPQPLLESLQTREIGDSDYEILMTLQAGPQEQGTVPLHVVNSFPLIKVTTSKDKDIIRLDSYGNCNICMNEIRFGDVVRQIPCKHGFHRGCIDRWLLQRRSTCPTCGCTAHFPIENETKTSLLPIKNAAARSKRRQKQVAEKIVETKSDSLFVQGQDCLQLFHSQKPLLFPLINIKRPFNPRYSGNTAKAAESENSFQLSLDGFQKSKEVLPSFKGKQSSLLGRKTFGAPKVTEKRLLTSIHPEAPDLAVTSVRFSS